MRRPLVPALLALFAMTAPMLAAEAVAPAPAPVQVQAPVIDPAQPESAILLPVKVLKDNDFKAFFLSLPAAEQDKARGDWKQAQEASKQPGAEANQAEFNAFLARLLAPGAVDALVAQAEPQLAQLNPQEASQGLQMMAGFLPMMLQANPQPGAKDPATQQRVAAYVTLLQGLCTDASQWILTAGLNDKAKLKEALTHLVAGAQALGVKDAADLQALPLEEFLGRLTPLVKEAKAALAIYGVEVDAFLTSVTVAAVAPAAGAPADDRTLNVSLKAFGKPYTVPVIVTRSENHWVVSPVNGAPFAALAGGGAGAEGAPIADPAGTGPGMPLEIAPAAPAGTPAAPVTP